MRPQKKTTSYIVSQTGIWQTLILGVFTLVLYINTIPNEYALDDKAIIVENKFTSKGFSGIPNLLTTSYWAGIDKNVRSYRPLSAVTFAIEIGFFGLNPHISHFINLLLYFITGLILFDVLKKMFCRLSVKIPEAIALITTLLFLAHPIHTEVVANIKSRDAMLELLFLLLSTRSLLEYLKQPSLFGLSASAFFFFLALLSKESAITFIIMVPVLMILFDDRPLAHKFKITLGYLIPVILFLLLYVLYSDFHAFQRLHLMDNMLIADESPAVILATKFLILFKYLLLLVYPFPLVYDYSYRQIPFTTFGDPLVLCSILIYLSIFLFTVYVVVARISKKKLHPGQVLVAFSVAWFFMGFFASSNLVLIIGSTMAERFMYSPSLGFLLLLVYGLYRLNNQIRNKTKKEKPPVLLFVIAGMILLCYTYGTINRNKAWKDDFTLFSTDIKYQEENAKANDFLANVYVKKGDSAINPENQRAFYHKAIALKEQAVAIYPKIPEIKQKLGYLYGNIGQFDKAIEKYQLSIQMNPGEIYNYIQISKAFGMLGKHHEAMEYIRQGEKIAPQHPEVLSMIGILLAQQGNLREALPYFEKVYVINPNDQQNKKSLDYTRSLLEQKP